MLEQERLQKQRQVRQASQSAGSAWGSSADRRHGYVHDAPYAKEERQRVPASEPQRNEAQPGQWTYSDSMTREARPPSPSGMYQRAYKVDPGAPRLYDDRPVEDDLALRRSSRETAYLAPRGSAPAEPLYRPAHGYAGRDDPAVSAGYVLDEPARSESERWDRDVPRSAVGTTVDDELRWRQLEDRERQAMAGYGQDLAVAEPSAAGSSYMAPSSVRARESERAWDDSGYASTGAEWGAARTAELSDRYAREPVYRAPATTSTLHNDDPALDRPRYAPGEYSRASALDMAEATGVVASRRVDVVGDPRAPVAMSRDPVGALRGGRMPADALSPYSDIDAGVDGGRAYRREGSPPGSLAPRGRAAGPPLAARRAEEGPSVAWAAASRGGGTEWEAAGYREQEEEEERARRRAWDRGEREREDRWSQGGERVREREGVYDAPRGYERVAGPGYERAGYDRIAGPQYEDVPARARGRYEDAGGDRGGVVPAAYAAREGSPEPYGRKVAAPRASEDVVRRERRLSPGPAPVGRRLPPPGYRDNSPLYATRPSAVQDEEGRPTGRPRAGSVADDSRDGGYSRAGRPEPRMVASRTTIPSDVPPSIASRLQPSPGTQGRPAPGAGSPRDLSPERGAGVVVTPGGGFISRGRREAMAREDAMPGEKKRASSVHDRLSDENEGVEGGEGGEGGEGADASGKPLLDMSLDEIILEKAKTGGDAEGAE
eukprot:jgi/Mesvir1/28764/Mv19731-RA.1